MITRESKRELIDRAIEHKNAKTLAKGVFAENIDWEDIKFYGKDHINLFEDFSKKAAVCAVGCLATPLNRDGSVTPMLGQSKAYNVLRDQFGIPTKLVGCADAIFELLPIEEAKHWPLEFALALPTEVLITDNEFHRIIHENKDLEYVYERRHNQSWEEGEEYPEAIEARDFLLKRLSTL